MTKTCRSFEAMTKKAMKHEAMTNTCRSFAAMTATAMKHEAMTVCSACWLYHACIDGGALELGMIYGGASGALELGMDLPAIRLFE